MIGLSMLLKAFGANVEEKHIIAIEQVIPTIPARLQQAAVVINSAINDFDQRLKAIEIRMQDINHSIEVGKDTLQMSSESVFEALNRFQIQLEEIKLVNHSHHSGSRTGVKQGGKTN